MQRRAHPGVWIAALVALAVVPLGLSTLVGRLPGEHGGMAWELGLGAGIVALSILVAAFALPSRLRVFTTHLGIENVLRAHRALAVLAVAFVLLHLAFVVASDPKHLGILDLRHAPPRVWAASTATLALLLVVALAITRRRRRPRYEGWRLVHVVLATAVLLGVALHVLWLHNLVDRAVTAAWFAFLAAIVAALFGYRWFWRALRSWRHSYVVEEIRAESPTAVNVAVKAHKHEGLPFEPGQFFWLKIGESPFVFEEHPFTIASSAVEPSRKEFTIKALGDFSELLSGMRPGRRIYLDGPHGRFTVDGTHGRGVVFIAGGVGITPMLSMIRTLAHRGDRRKLLLVAGGRTIDELLHREEVEALRAEVDLSVVEVLDKPPEEWGGESGFVNAELLERYVPHIRHRRRHDYFLCGSPPMVTAVLAALHELGVPDRRIHTELFDMV
ncbi:MAG: hypothetical protein QOC73_2223 [Actinomycetota bacterium]|nr:hypothetical protein [Actinomycetota bacterium]MDQ1541054.1 hypothetical protein [Actinomycetota bacterium]